MRARVPYLSGKRLESQVSHHINPLAVRATSEEKGWTPGPLDPVPRLYLFPTMDPGRAFLSPVPPDTPLFCINSLREQNSSLAHYQIPFQSTAQHPLIVALYFRGQVPLSSPCHADHG
jgi:hypothetical protein